MNKLENKITYNNVKKIQSTYGRSLYSECTDDNRHALFMFSMTITITLEICILRYRVF